MFIKKEKQKFREEQSSSPKVRNFAPHYHLVYMHRSEKGGG